MIDKGMNMINLRRVMILVCFTLSVSDIQLNSMSTPLKKTASTKSVKSVDANSAKDVVMNSGLKRSSSKQNITPEQKMEMQHHESNKIALKRTSSSSSVAATAPPSPGVTIHDMNRTSLSRSSSSSSIASQSANTVIENGTKPLRDYVEVLQNSGLKEVPKDLLQAAAKNIVDIQADAGNKGVGGLMTLASNVASGGLAKARDLKKIEPINLKKEVNDLVWENPTNGVPQSNIYKSLKIVEDIYKNPSKPMTEVEAPYVEVLSKKYSHVNKEILLDYVREFLRTQQKYEQKPAGITRSRWGGTVDDRSRPIEIKPIEVLQRLDLPKDKDGKLVSIDLSPLQERYLTLKTLEKVNEKYLSRQTVAKIQRDTLQLNEVAQNASSNNIIRQVSRSNSALVAPEIPVEPVDIPQVSSEKGNAQNLLNIVPEVTKSWWSKPIELTEAQKEAKRDDIYNFYQKKYQSSNLESAFIALNKDIIALEKNKTDANQVTISIAKNASQKMEDAIAFALVKKIVHTELSIDQALTQSKKALEDVMARNSTDSLQVIVNQQYQKIYTEADRLLHKIKSKFNEYEQRMDRDKALQDALNFEAKSNGIGDSSIMWSGVIYQLKRETQAFKAEQAIANNLWNQSKPVEKALERLQLELKDTKAIEQIKFLESQYLINLDISQKEAIAKLQEGLNDLSMERAVKKTSGAKNNAINFTPDVIQEINKYQSVLRSLAGKIDATTKYTDALMPEKSRNFDANIRMLQRLQKDVNLQNLEAKIKELKKAVKDSGDTIPDIKTAYEFLAYCKQMIEQLQLRKSKRLWQKAGTQAAEGWVGLTQGKLLSGSGNILASVPKGAVALDGIFRENVTSSLAAIGIDENSLQQETKDKITAYIQRTIYLLLLFGPLAAGIYGSLSLEEKLRMQKAILRAFWGDVATAVIVDKTGASEHAAASGNVSEILLSAGLNKATGGYNPNEGGEEYKGSLERLHDNLAAKQQAKTAAAAA